MSLVRPLCQIQLDQRLEHLISNQVEHLWYLWCHRCSKHTESEVQNISFLIKGYLIWNQVFWVAKDVRYIRVALSHFIHSLYSNKIHSEVVQLILLSLLSLGSWFWPPTYPLQPIIPPIASSNLNSFIRRFAIMWPESRKGRLMGVVSGVAQKAQTLPALPFTCKAGYRDWSRLPRNFQFLFPQNLLYPAKLFFFYQPLPTQKCYTFMK
jgi:hypothetical protein